MPPTEPQRTRASTKIVATIGPASWHPQILAGLVEDGVDVFRINMAHGTRAEHDEVLASIRDAAQQHGRPVGVLVDLAGPKIRLGDLVRSPLPVAEGDEFTLVRGEVARQPDELTTTYASMIDELDRGDVLFLGDGQVSMTVVDKTAESARLRVTQSGEIRSRQGLNLPGVRLSAPALTEADRDNAVWAAERGADFVSLSFVRTAAEIHLLKKLLRDHRSPALVIAKIEKREAIESLDEIVAATDGVMVARGDLGVEIDVARTPVVQKQIIDACRRLWRPVIVATEMLDSMQRQRRPTRAEATDVANAILDGADACMLSGETAIGQYPREAVRMMNRIMLATEEMLPAQDNSRWPATRAGVHPVTSAVVQGATTIADRVQAKLMVIATRSGATARVKAKLRSRFPTLGVTTDNATLRQMCLYWGIIPLAGAPVDNPPALRQFVDAWGLAEGSLEAGDLVVFVTGTGLVAGAHNLVVVHDVVSAT
ncbi:MAG: pyruvate kinase [Pirellulaceae bacterium]|nr:pyruvate kinase [Pirellulaceae bacterium]